MGYAELAVRSVATLWALALGHIFWPKNSNKVWPITNGATKSRVLKPNSIFWALPAAIKALLGKQACITSQHPQNYKWVIGLLK